MTSEFHPMSAPYKVWLAPSGTLQWSPTLVADLPPSPWVGLEDGEIAQNPVSIIWGRETEKEPPAQNDQYSTRVYIKGRDVMLKFSMKNVGQETIAKLLDDADVTTEAATSTKAGYSEFEFTEDDPYYWSMLLMGMGQMIPNGPKLPKVIWLAHAYYVGSLQYDTERIKPTMIDVSFDGLKHPVSGKIGSDRRITAPETP